ncbi:hypothetical protein CHM34_06770 [Paludifilum halophilum]|uniref:Uncharacterized protein n=1 Tax=Paludifilum halophilum TaxID=1642702 RepID=A0A235B881_9BACL|nr:hypothetical protein CHM34_06770 [Paludifilum halophilum]
MGEKAAWARKKRFDNRVLFWVRRGYTLNQVSHILGCNVTKVIASVKRLKADGKLKYAKK